MLSIDAHRTGSLIKNIRKPDESTHYVFLYQVIVPFKMKILLVLQMISEKHDTNILIIGYKNGCDLEHFVQRRLQSTILLHS